MRNLPLLSTLLAVVILAGQAAAQAPGTAPDISGPQDPPAIVEERPDPDDQEETRILPGEETFVQIRGTWSVDPEDCPITGRNTSGLYVTDTIISWQSATCNIRNIDSTNATATIHAFCASEQGRRDRVFELEVTGEDTLSLSFLAEGETHEVTLQRCETED